MGLSMLAGLIGTVLYGSYCVKNDIQAITTDNSIKPTLNQKDNERKLRINFEAICVFTECFLLNYSKRS